MNNQPYYLSSEEHLATTFREQIEPFWQQHVTQGNFAGVAGIRVNYAYCIPKNAGYSVLISSGRIESLLKYKEVIYEFYRNNVAVFIVDHRGQGLSGRMSGNPHHGYVDHFDEYVDDLCWFIDNVVTPRQRGALHLLCHSMGAAIGALTILAKPDCFARAVFCAPMFGIRPALPGWLAAILIGLSRLYNSLPGTKGYFFGQRDYHADAFGCNRLTSSETRYQLFRTLYSQQPEIQLGGVTPQWLAAASNAMWDIEHHAAKIHLPALVFSAQNDTVVDNQRQARVAAHMPGAEFVSVAGARHEILIECDAIRQPVIQRILSFFSAGQ
ncbi:alpha/beta fold hydrolase [Alteromonas gilva]|uniref:Alpha/beta fold hydrolase n=1 Tax=Alteromonas gilva TaxID=2987522 RepID=A0ABT5L6U1_9ALTE|nr:alpha/beta fold hydrolase [Alteromonas gilva]MDC8832134.1 alpha/beta fold hydrolase [Alteromonas gilva]